jgi:hypothetical protein
LTHEAFDQPAMSWCHVHESHSHVKSALCRGYASHFDVGRERLSPDGQFQSRAGSDFGP